MTNKILLTESDLHRIVKQVIRETVDEHGMGMIGAYQATADNLRNRYRLGQKERKLSNGQIQNNKSRFISATQNIKQEIMKEFYNTFGENGVTLSCSCWYFKSYVYEFEVHVRGIEQINTRNFSIYGDITSVDDSLMAATLKSTLVPKKLNDIVLVYNFANRSLSFTSKKSGLVIKPEDEHSDGWFKLLGLVGEFNAAYTKMAR